MVGEGVGMTLMPELAVPSKTRKSDPIRYLPFTTPKPSRRIGMLYRRGSYRQAAFATLQKLIKQTLP